MKPRSLQEIAFDQVMDNMLIKWSVHAIYDEPILMLAIPATKRDVWMYKHISNLISDFIAQKSDYYFANTSHQTKIDITRVLHKDLKRLLRKMYKHYPVEFGYALKAPCDMHDMEMAKRVAAERLIKKIKGAV